MLDLEKVKDEDVVPDGWYNCYIEKAEFKESPTSGAEYLNLMIKLIGGEYGNRVVWNILNIFHPNEQPRNISLRELKKMLAASDINNLKFESNEDLLDAVLACRFQVKLSNKTDDFGKKNIVKGYKKIIEEDAVDASDIPF